MRAVHASSLVALLVGPGCAETYSSCSGYDDLEYLVVDTSSGAAIFEWSPGDAYVISVADRDGTDMWRVQCGGDNNVEGSTLQASACVPSPMVYGDEVDSVFFDRVNHVPARRLKARQRYTVIVGTFVDSDDPGCGIGFVGEKRFTAP